MDVVGEPEGIGMARNKITPDFTLTQ
jgi:hypothetical protein